MKLTTVAAVLFFCTSSVQAQTISLGPTVGFGHSSLKIKDSELNSKFYPSYNIGAKLVYSIKSHWGISADLKLSAEGGKLKANMTPDFKRQYRAYYVRIPFQGVYFFGKLDDPVRPKISLGPSLGFLIGGKTTETINVDAISVKTKDLLEGFDLGINTSFGANFRLKGDKWLNADITYYHGITNISGFVNNIKNRSIGFNIGILFPIGE
jgi:outer membrane protein W